VREWLESGVAADHAAEVEGLGADVVLDDDAEAELAAGVPDDLPPDELTLAAALQLLAAPRSDEPIGELDGLPVFAKNGRYGPYVQWGTADEPPPGMDKPKMASLFKSMSLETLTPDQARALLTLPRTLGVDDDGEPIVVNNGRYGPFVQKGKEYRSLESEDLLLTVGIEAAKQLLAAPKQFRRSAPATAKPPLREFPADPISGRPVVVKEGKFGPYVTDGETNASLTRGDRLDAMPPERAYELLALRRASDAEKGVTPKKKGGRAPKAAASAKATPAKRASKKVAPKAPADAAAPEKKKPTVVRRAKGE
jgi:DNA topoisomerase-1